MFTCEQKVFAAPLQTYIAAARELAMTTTMGGVAARRPRTQRMALGKVGFADGAFETCRATSACPGLSGALRAMAGSLLALVSAAGAWGIFAATHADLGWSLSVLVAGAYLIAIGALQWLLLERYSVAYRRAADERDRGVAIERRTRNDARGDGAPHCQ